MNWPCALNRSHLLGTGLARLLRSAGPMKNFVRTALASVLVLSTMSTMAFADEGDNAHRPGFLLDSSPQSRPMLLSVHGVLPYSRFGAGGFPLGAGVSFYIPIVRDGFIPPVNDEFGIDFGADAFFFAGYRNFFGLWIPVSVLWTFHFTDTFAAYVKAGVALRFWPGEPAPFYPDFVGAVGLNWMFARSVGLRVELGYPGLKVGLLFAF